MYHFWSTPQAPYLYPDNIHPPICTPIKAGKDVALYSRVPNVLCCQAKLQSCRNTKDKYRNTKTMHRKIQRQGGRGVGIIGGRGVVGVLSPLRWARDSPLPRAQVVQSRIKIQKYRKYTVEIHCDQLLGTPRTFSCPDGAIHTGDHFLALK